MTTLADLFTTLDARGALPAKRVKDIKTSINKYLVVALGAASAQQCPVDPTWLEEDGWKRALDTHFQALIAEGKHVGAVTIRNTHSNVQTVLKAAAAHGLLTAPRIPAKGSRKGLLRQHQLSSPYRTAHYSKGDATYSLPLPQWPADIQAGWQAFLVACAGDGRQQRETTLRSYTRWLACYWGYLRNIRGHTPAWADLFELPLLMAYVHWHTARMGRPRTVQARHVVSTSATIATALKHANAPAITKYRNGMPRATALHDKRRDYHKITRTELEAVANACLAEGRLPVPKNGRHNLYPGAMRASRFQRGVVIKILVRIPLRQRNIREMQWDRHLFQENKAWHLRFIGDDLKIGYRGNEENTYSIAVTELFPELGPVLTEWKEVYRPKLPNAAASPFVFLARHGTPFTKDGLYYALANEVAVRTGKRFYPHLIRSIYATTGRDAGVPMETMAIMLGDTLLTTQRSYYTPDIKRHQINAAAWSAKELAGASQGGP